MAKRGMSHASHEQSKRVKVAREVPSSEPVTSARQLKKLLAFERDSRRARHGLQSFKLLLDQMTIDGPHEDEAAILSGYLEAVRPSAGDGEPVFLSEIMDTWAYAARYHNDDLLSQVAAILALLLHVGSQSLQFLADMRGICDTILQEKQLKLIAKNLSADQDLGYVISPALRLLREVVGFDGGVFVMRVFRAQEWTFAELPRNLDVRYRGEGVEDARKPSVRTNAARFLLDLIKCLPSYRKVEMFSIWGIMSGLLRGMIDDPPSLIHETLECMKKDVLMDRKISRQAKSRLFRGKILVRLVGLYYYSHDSPDCEVSVVDKVHEFFVFACTSPDAGIVSKCNGFYPTSLELESLRVGDPAWKNMGLTQLSWMEQFASEIPVNNGTLLEVTEKLRPWAKPQHNQLLVAMFRVAPELMAAYFRSQNRFDFEPNLSMTWVGYAAFVYGAVQLPIPDYFGFQGDSYARAPPPTSVLLDNILPPSLTKTALVRCFEPKWPLVSLFATQILVVALEKLEAALRMHVEADPTGGRDKSSSWRLAPEKLLNDIAWRIPDLKDIVRWYKSIPEDNILCRTSTSRLLVLYYKVVPLVAAGARHDAAPFIAESLETVVARKGDHKDQAMALTELENLLDVASLSPGMRWFSKFQGQSLSAFIILLQLCSRGLEGLSLDKLKETLTSLVVGYQLVLPGSGLRALDRTFAQLKSKKASGLDYVWSFLDTCVTRCASSTLKYVGLASEYGGDACQAGKEVGISLLPITMAEQLPFATKSAKTEDLQVLLEFLSAYLGNAVLVGESRVWTDAIVLRMNAGLPGEMEVRMGIPESVVLDKNPQSVATLEEPMSPTQESLPARPKRPRRNERERISQDTLEGMLHEPFPVPQDNAALTRWATKSVDDLIDDSDAIELARLLGSEHVSIRKEAITNLRKMAAKVHESSYSEKVQVWLLLSELVESSRELVDSGPVPSAFLALVIHALPILTDPGHLVYAKINKYLIKAPAWPVSKIPLIHDILNDAPAEDGGFYAELEWLFQFVLDCLQTRKDLDVFRQSKWFEAICAESCNPFMSSSLRIRVFKILYRATCIEGGSTTLVTRFGMIPWLEMQTLGALSVEEKLTAGALMERVWMTCDQEHVSDWSQGAIPAKMRRRALAGLSSPLS